MSGISGLRPADPSSCENKGDSVSNKSFTTAAQALALMALATSSLSAAAPPVAIHAPSAKEMIIASFPRTGETVAEFRREALDEFGKSLEEFLSVSERSFENTIKNWNRIASALNSKKWQIASIKTTTKDAGAIEEAEKTYVAINGALEEAFKNPKVVAAMVSFLEKAAAAPDSLTPSEWQYAYQMAASINPSDLPPGLMDKIAAQPRLPFTALRGNAQEKTGNGPFTVLNANTNSFMLNQPMMYGGVLPWKSRIDPLAGKLISSGADVLCLQEYFDEEASVQLYERLKDEYAYFYINIGPRNFGMNMDTQGISSGLFVASKYRIEDPRFTQYAATPSNRNYGLFDFKITSQDQVLGHIGNTHLQPFNDQENGEIRRSELQQATDLLQADASTEAGVPFILCGDMNTQWNSGEPAELVIKQHYFDAYNQGRTEADIQNSTCVDLTDYWWNVKPFNPEPEYVDYALLLKGSGNDQFTLATKKIPLNNLAHPEEALSDHDALLTLVSKINCALL